ncbi:MAG: DUF5329 domain-containing protein [Gammaproteobacteria bacterium]|nr:DUF5329 domain-containing protein [Gammaproteobacteria bacterium]
MTFLRPIIIAGLLVPLFAAADATDTVAEIEYLLTTLGTSECTFIRNGKRHNAENAEEHLRMKHRRGKRYVTTAETFIERLASSSSMSKKPYYVECSGDEPVPSGDWLMQRLSEYRAGR